MICRIFQLIVIIASLFPLFSSPISTQKDELVAVELEIADIDDQINALRLKRSQLLERQKQLQKTLDDQRILAFQGNSIEQWQRTGIPSVCSP